MYPNEKARLDAGPFVWIERRIICASSTDQLNQRRLHSSIYAAAMPPIRLWGRHCGSAVTALQTAPTVRRDIGLNAIKSSDGHMTEGGKQPLSGRQQQYGVEPYRIY